MNNKDLVMYLNGLITETENSETGVSHETINQIPEKIAGDILKGDQRVAYFCFYDFVGIRKLYLETVNHKKEPKTFLKHLKKRI